MPPDLRDTVVDFVQDWSDKAGVSKCKFLIWLKISESKFYNWTLRYGKINSHNGKIPRDFWLNESEREAILQFHAENPLEGYRRLAFMMTGFEQPLIANEHWHTGYCRRSSIDSCEMDFSLQ